MRAIELIDAAKACGADAVKFQAVTAETITLDCDRPEFRIDAGPWAGWNLFELYEKTETPFDWFPYIKARADEIGMTWFASVFDRSAVDLMDRLNAPAIKIASFELVDIPLIKYAAETGRPMILSTGMAGPLAIESALDATKPAPAALLHCVSAYPTPASEANLPRLATLRHHFREIPVGISDHGGSEIPIAATALGASIIEKHFRLRHHPDTEDSPFSLDEEQFAAMTRGVRNTWDAMQARHGTGEESSRPLRRSLFCVADIKEGDLFSETNVRSIRPGHGAPPASIDMFIGKRAARDIARGEPARLDMIAENPF